MRSSVLSLLLVGVIVSLLCVGISAQLGCQPITTCQNAPQPMKLPAAPIPECLCDSCPCQDEFPPLPSGVLGERKHRQVRQQISELSAEDSGQESSTDDLQEAYKAAKAAKRMRIARQREMMKAKIQRHREDLSRLREIADELKQQFRVLKQHTLDLKNVIKINRNTLKNFDARSGESDSNPLQLKYAKKSVDDIVKSFQARQLEQKHLLDRVHQFNKQAIAEGIESIEQESSNDEYDLYNVV